MWIPNQTTRNLRDSNRTAKRRTLQWPTPQHKFTEVQGIKLHYLEWGEPGKPDLLLVHGWTNFSASWTAVAEYFHDRYHIVAPDLRGHGESDKPQTGYRLRDFAEDIRQLIKNLELTQARLRRPFLGR